MGRAALEQSGPDRNTELAVVRSIHPTNRPGVPASVQRLELIDEVTGHVLRLTADRRRRVQSLRERDPQRDREPGDRIDTIEIAES